VTPDFTIPVSTNERGFLDYGLPLPADPRLLGLSIHVQAGTLDASQPAGFALSQRLTLEVGP
jgi:hypothetical protein